MAGGACYETLDNGSRAFRVCLGDQEFVVYKNAAGFGEPDRWKETALGPRRYTRVFVGKSGRRWEGNSLLFAVPAGRLYRYVFVGTLVLEFDTQSPVVKYGSPVGNNGVPYPFAVDAAGSIYLILDDEVIRLSRGAYGAGVPRDPWRYFYKISVIADRSMRKPRFEGIEGFFVGSRAARLSYTPYPDKHYARVRRLLGRNKLYVARRGGREELTRSKYVALIRRFGAEKGFEGVEERRVLVRRRG